MEELKATDEQLAWVDTLRAREPSFLSARAGTGKTTTIRLGVETGLAEGWLKAEDILIVAFNKRNQEDLVEKLPAGIRVSTMHALGYSALRGYLRRVDLDEDKSWKLLGAKGQGHKALKWQEKLDTLRAIKQMKILGGNWYKNKDIPKWVFEENPDLNKEALWRVLEEGEKEAREKGRIDFSDMILLPWLWGLNLGGYSWVIIDEAQDLAPMDWDLIRKIVGKKWLVGDPYQRIYQFRDRQGEGFLGDQLERLGIKKTLGLTQCWRCADRILEEARRLVPDIRGCGRMGEFKVVGESKVDWSTELPATILSRTNRDLVRIGLGLKDSGRPVYFVGKEFATRLQDILAALKGEDLFEALETYQAKVIARVGESEGLADACEALRFFLLRCKGKKDWAKREIEKFFLAREIPGAWVLSTIHRAKGLEWDKVFMLDWDASRDTEEERRNLLYVALTRAKKELIWIQRENGVADEEDMEIMKDWI